MANELFDLLKDGEEPRMHQVFKIVLLGKIISH